jgi:23S rRNA (cytidine1920-2'-O)/16S rRNA (cytidine1409-2'-O)-methyltransferase
MKKLKLDELLVNRGFIPSIDEAKRYIMAGKVLIDDTVISQPGTLCDPLSHVRIKEKKSNYVSRGGDKIAHFLETQRISIHNQCCLDIGISTGGFSDVLIQKNARHVLGIDVGYGILDYQLRKNKKLSLLERTNAREVTEKEINNALEPFQLNIDDIQLVVMDVSFISVFKIMPNLLPQLPNSTEYIILIKPQFEAERDMVDMGGIITNPDHLRATLNKVDTQFSALNLNIWAKSASEVKGAKGNQEYFYRVSKRDAPSQ